MARLMLIANPAASQFTGGDHRSIVSLLARRHLVEAVWPQSAVDARTIAADAITAGFDGVVAMGGDGIVHHVAQSLVGTDVYLGVIPAGTTNVFARQIGVPAKPLPAARLLAAEPEPVPQPTLEVEATLAGGGTVVAHAVFAAGIGLDADVVAVAETEPYRKYRFGAAHYARTSLELLWGDLRHRRPTLVVRAGDESHAAVGVMAQFHRAFTYFGRRPLTFDAEPPSPVTLLAVESLPMRRLPAVVARLALGRSLGTLPGLAVLPSVEMCTVEARPPARCQVDGEVLGTLEYATFTHRAAELWVAGPGA